jgi:Pyruvate/2-oxoacid:ferredoxin oxidoreductase gamma subunit
MLNMFMLGCLSCFVPLKVAIWKESIAQRLPASIRKINLTAFEQGRKEMRDVHLRED